MKEKILNRLVWIMVGILLSLAVQEIMEKYKAKKTTKKILTISISSVDRELSKLYLLNFNTAVFDYKAKDTLFIHRKPIEIRLKENYDMLLKDPDVIRQMDADFHDKIEKFKDDHDRLSSWYNRLPNDFERNKLKDEIIGKLYYQKEVLVAELDYLKSKISKDSLIDVRENAFRKYINFDLLSFHEERFFRN